MPHDLSGISDRRSCVTAWLTSDPEEENWLTFDTPRGELAGWGGNQNHGHTGSKV